MSATSSMYRAGGLSWAISTRGRGTFGRVLQKIKRGIHGHTRAHAEKGSARTGGIGECCAAEASNERTSRKRALSDASDSSSDSDAIGCPRRLGQTTRSQSKVTEILPPVQLNTSIFDIALSAERRALALDKSAQPLPDDEVDEPSTVSDDEVEESTTSSDGEKDSPMTVYEGEAKMSAAPPPATPSLKTWAPPRGPPAAMRGGSRRSAPRPAPNHMQPANHEPSALHADAQASIRGGPVRGRGGKVNIEKPTLNHAKRKSKKKRGKTREARDAKDRAEHGGLRRHDRPAVFRVLRNAQTVELCIEMEFDVDDKEDRTFPVASTGWTDARVGHTPEEMNDHDLSWFMKRGFTYQKTDCRYSLCFLDKHRRVILMFAGQPPDDPTWMQNHDEVVKLFEETKKNAKVPASSSNRRGTWAANVGYSMGGGQTKPSNISLGSNKKVIEKLRDRDEVRRIALFMDRCFMTYQRTMYKHYEENMGRLRLANPKLRANWEPDVFAAATFNFGPRSVARVHTDDKNFAAGWCGIMALGNFDHTKGGHMVLWDLKLVVEFPPGTVMFIPSAILRHSNTTIADHEKRMSFTQFTAGALFRWVDCGMQTQKDFFAKGGVHEKTGTERWLDGIGRFSTWEELMERAEHAEQANL